MPASGEFTFTNTRKVLVESNARELKPWYLYAVTNTGVSNFRVKSENYGRDTTCDLLAGETVNVAWQEELAIIRLGGEPPAGRYEFLAVLPSDRGLRVSSEEEPQEQKGKGDEQVPKTEA